MAGICLFMVSVSLVSLMSAYFTNVIIDNRVLNENSIFKILTEANAFMKHLKENVSGHRLLNDYQWLHHFEMLILSNCHIVPDSLKYLCFTGYVMAAYNTFLMYVLLSGTLPVSVLASIPIITSFISGYIDPSRIVLLGLFEFSQALLSMAIIITFIFLNERKTRFQAIVNEHREH